VVSETIKTAKTKFKDKKIVLYVKEDNVIAQNIYKKAGFISKYIKDSLCCMELI